MRHCVNLQFLWTLPRHKLWLKSTYLKLVGALGVEFYFEKLEGVISATSGYIGGHMWKSNLSNGM